MKTFFKISFKAFKIIFKILFFIPFVFCVLLNVMAGGDDAKKSRDNEEQKMLPFVDSNGNPYYASKGSSPFYYN